LGAYDVVDDSFGPDSTVGEYVWIAPINVNGTTATTKKKKEKFYYNTCNRSGWPWNFTWRCVLSSHYSDGKDQCQTDSDCGPPSVSPPPVAPSYSCMQCRGTTCSLRNSPTPCVSTCRTNSDCRTPVSPPSNGTNGNGGTPPSNGGYTPPVSPPPVLPETQPCMINYFELPERAWVGYPITGRWSASDWCDDCDVSCTPYPECVWKKDSIGTGFDEDKFTIEQSGTYYYTLTCYGPGGIDERTEPATVKALNLPWWREIIPVLQGFLGGV